MRSRLRRWVAARLDRLAGQCGADLAMWANGHTPRTTPWSPRSPGCTVDAVRNGACTCGKLGRDGAIYPGGAEAGPR